MDSPWIFAGGAAVVGLLASCWEYVRSIYQQVSGRLVVRVATSGYQSDALLVYLNERFSASTFGPRAYCGWMLHVQPRLRTQLVAMEVLSSDGRLYWLGWRPIWVAKGRLDDTDIEGGVTARDDYASQNLSITFLRGTFSADSLILRACETYNEQMASSTRRRHFVRHLYGTVGRRFPQGGSHNRTGSPSSAGDTRACAHHRPLGWELDELGFQSAKQSSVDQLALAEDSIQLVQEARFWKENEQWYRARGIPWRRGWMLHGEPGTGKTALIRATAEELDLPVFVYDLASLRNEELQNAWSKMLCDVPCVAVIEDVDAVFRGRENIACEDDGLTFDCLLNCLDGIERSDGLLLTITTNHIEHVDPALGRPNNDEISSRPGRIDRTIRIGPLTERARQKMVRRILIGFDEIHEAVVQSGKGDTAARFQERCSRIALELLWGNKERSNVTFVTSFEAQADPVGN